MAGARRSLRVVPELTLGALLRTQRLNDDLTQEELAERFQTRQQTIGAWERGGTPQPRYYGPLAEFLGLQGEAAVRELLAAEPTGTQLMAAPELRRTGNSEANTSGVDAVLTSFARRIEHGPPLTLDELAALERIVGQVSGGDQSSAGAQLT